MGNVKNSPGCNCCAAATYTIDGQVKSICTSNFINSVTVELRNGSNTSTLATTTTSGSGSYSFTGVSPGSYNVRINNSGTWASRTNSATVGVTVTSSNVTVATQTPTTKTGFVCACSTDFPIPTTLHATVDTHAVTLSGGGTVGLNYGWTGTATYSYSGSSCNSNSPNQICVALTLCHNTWQWELEWDGCLSPTNCKPTLPNVFCSYAHPHFDSVCNCCTLTRGGTTIPPFTVSGSCTGDLVISSISVTE